MNLSIPVVDMTEQLMGELQEIGVIERLVPGKHRLNVSKGESRHKSLYETKDTFGGHKIITVTINSTVPKNFLYHNDNEDFWLIDEDEREPLILTICKLKIDTLIEKIKARTLSADDFVSVRCVFNNPNLSFFTMHKEYAHVETVLNESDLPPSFYVTESRNLDEVFIDLDGYQLIIEKG